MFVIKVNANFFAQKKRKEVCYNFFLQVNSDKVQVRRGFIIISEALHIVPEVLIKMFDEKDENKKKLNISLLFFWCSKIDKNLMERILHTLKAFLYKSNCINLNKN